ncbi:hypothetical protein CLV84_2952 [Neolewinella xylanilytica]|uniref:DoxX-like protein n=1 Tax=Neolewinella xylanilytica TaxID=1514080 RepID=A0A2S6I4D4_9BACT|nr:hypothetical protein [Neolewinella xylanilytica]PPK86035.1 hypothetical protein CLV84_2952 [Neolewinella xylanilytica]
MFAIHEKGIGRTRRLLGYILSLLPSLGVLASGVTKFFPNTEIHLLLQALGMDDYAIPIGLIEMAIVVLYWVPRTSNFGFFLFCSYIGGIFVAELMLGDVPLPALTIGAMIYLGTLLRKPSLIG